MLTVGELTDRGCRFFIFSVITPIIATPIVLCRIWVRIRLTKSFGADDWLLLAALAFFLGLSAVDIFIALLGYGDHQYNIAPDTEVELWKGMYANGILLYLCLIALRLSICNFFLRIAAVKWQRYLVWVIAIVTPAMHVVNLFWLNIFYCWPIDSYWNPYVYSDCVSNRVEKELLYIQYSLSVLSDWAMSILAAFFIVNLSMKARNKLVTIGLLLLGVFASISSIICIVYIPTDDNTDDFSYTSYPIFTAQPIEPFLGMLATSLATFRPLLRKLQQEYLSYTSSYWRHRPSQCRSDDMENSAALAVERSRRPTLASLEETDSDFDLMGY